MSLKNFFKRFNAYLIYNFLLKKIRPEIIGGFHNPGGKFYSKVGISNFTHISNQGDNLNIGDNVFIGHFNYIDAFNAKVVIGNHVQITNYVSILTHTTHLSIRLTDFDSSSEHFAEILKMGEIHIGDYTYVGPHVVIMPGTKIGKGCIVSAFSFVRGEYPDFSVVRGQPAKVMGDVRNMDKKYIDIHPDLKKFYSENTKNI